MTDISELPAHDYSVGDPRQHHSLYLEDGTFVMQVEKAIFKVHRFFLAKYSKVLKEMFDTTKESRSSEEGTDTNPVVFPGDSASGWELLLGDIYDRDPIMDPKERTYTGEQLLSLLGIAHKYCMEEIETSILWRLRRDTSITGFVDRIVASRMIDSKVLYEQSVQGLINSNAQLDLDQLRRVGLDAVHAILANSYVKIKEAKDGELRAQARLQEYNNMQCRRCSRVLIQMCGYCL